MAEKRRTSEQTIVGPNDLTRMVSNKNLKKK